MLFGLTNALVIFQAYINKVLLGLLDTICVVYLNNIVVYSNDYKIYMYYMRMVLEKLREYILYMNLNKYSFYATSINFLGFVININGVLIKISRVDAIREWPYP